MDFYFSILVVVYHFLEFHHQYISANVYRKSQCLYLDPLHYNILQLNKCYEIRTKFLKICENCSYVNSSSAKTNDLIAPQTFDEIKSNGLDSPTIIGLLSK